MKSLNDYPNCLVYNKVVTKAIAEENKLVFELENNPKYKIAKWKIDKCILKADDGNKCDFLIVIDDLSTCYWVELKSEDFDYACLQIHSSINNIEEAKHYKTHFARIVFNKFKADRNRIDNIRYVNQKKLMNLIGGMKNLSYKNKILTETI